MGTTTTSTRPSLPLEFWLILLIMWTEPLCATVIDPFVNSFIHESGIWGDEAKTGYYTGIIESVFYIGESLSVVFRAHLSDRYGRRLILLLGLLALSISTHSFSSVRSFADLVPCFLLGLSPSIFAYDSTHFFYALGVTQYFQKCIIALR